MTTTYRPASELTVWGPLLGPRTSATASGPRFAGWRSHPAIIQQNLPLVVRATNVSATFVSMRCRLWLRVKSRGLMGRAEN